MEFEDLQKAKWTLLQEPLRVSVTFTDECWVDLNMISVLGNL